MIVMTSVFELEKLKKRVDRLERTRKASAWRNRNRRARR